MKLDYIIFVFALLAIVSVFFWLREASLFLKTIDGREFILFVLMPIISLLHSLFLLPIILLIEYLFYNEKQKKKTRG